jgi:HAD superfamily hydrolase (TIGR01509 family)
VTAPAISCADDDGGGVGRPGTVAAMTSPACVVAPVVINRAPSRGQTSVPAGNVLWQVGQLGTAAGSSLTFPGMAEPKRGFIFDLDGTLVDTMPSHFVAWTEIARRHGFEFPEARFYSLGGVPTAKIAAMLIAEAGLKLDPVAIALEKEQMYYDSLAAAGGIRPIAAVIDIARRHRSDGPLAIASGSVRRLVTRTLDALRIADWFPVIVAAEDTARHKPEPDVFLEAARRMGVDPAACTVYEDTDIGLEAARRAGMTAIDVRPLIRDAA